MESFRTIPQADLYSQVRGPIRCYLSPMLRSLVLSTVTILAFPTHAQTLQNGDFSEACDTCRTGLAHWALSWATSGVECKQYTSDTFHWLSIDCSKKDGVGFVEQTLNIPEVKDPIVFTLSAQVKVERLSAKGASLNIACYDAEDGFLTNKDQGLFWYDWIQGTRGWREQVLKLILPVGTTKVKVGAIVRGQGEAHFDDFTATLTPLTDRLPDQPAIDYVNAACDTIQAHSLYRDSVDLDALRSTALSIAGNTNDAADRHLAVEYLLQGLGDHHSFLMRPETFKAWEGEEGGGVITYASHRVIDGYGYLLVPGFMNGDSLAMQAFADSLQGAIRWLSAQDIKGWIVDLRKNDGGNMAPMVCGLGPLLAPGVLGTLTHITGRVERWYCRDGAYGWDDVPVMRATSPVALPAQLPIAVFTAQPTGSSGECTTISFIGNPRTRSFGQETFGLTTGNGQFALPDGAQMFLASTIMGDRSGELFHGPIVPDQVVEQPPDWSHDATLDAGLQWLKSQH